MKINDELLVAFCDGELDSNASGLVERALAVQPELRLRLDLLRKSDQLIRGSLGDILIEPLPFIDMQAQVSSSRFAKSHKVPLSLAIAASLVMLLVGGVLSQMWIDKYSRQPVLVAIDEVNQRHRMNVTLIRVLERQQSGIPFVWQDESLPTTSSITVERTWRKSSGEFCREYDYRYTHQGNEERETGIACRKQDGTWLLKLVVYPEGEKLDVNNIKVKS